MDKELLTKFQSVVDSFNRKKFTSHDFIKKILEKYEDDYRDIFSVKTLIVPDGKTVQIEFYRFIPKYFFKLNPIPNNPMSM